MFLKHTKIQKTYLNLKRKIISSFIAITNVIITILNYLLEYDLNNL